MFKPFAVSDTFQLPVTAPLPDDKGRKVNTKFTLVCKRLEREEVLAMWKAVQPVFPATDAAATEGADASAEPPRKQMTDDEVIDQVVVGFGGDILDQNNAPLAWTLENKRAVFAVHPVTECTVQAFFDYYMKAGRKN